MPRPLDVFDTPAVALSTQPKSNGSERQSGSGGRRAGGNDDGDEGCQFALLTFLPSTNPIDDDHGFVEPRETNEISVRRQEKNIESNGIK